MSAKGPGLVLSRHLRSEHWNAQHDGWVECMCGEAYTAEHQLAELKKAGYALVQLPERHPSAFPGEFPRFPLDRGECVIADTTFGAVLLPGWPDLNVDEAREIASALLAAADAAEGFER